LPGKFVRASIHRRPIRARALLAVLAVSLACSQPAPEAAWPAGALLSADRHALARLLDELSQLEQTPLARLASELRASLPECAQVEAHAADADPRALFAALRCADASGPLAAFHTSRGSHALAFALPGAPEARIHGYADLDSHGTRLALSWPLPDGSLAGLLPGEEPAGADRLADAERVAHARLRAQGPVDLAALVPEGSQGDRLFRLRSELFGAAVLDGSIELALYLPESGAQMPRAAAAFGVRQPEIARAAVEHFVGEIASTWSLRRTDFEHGSARGACLPDLQLVPELAPCYALSGNAVVLGWNPASLQHALATPPEIAEADTGSERAAARFDVDLSGIATADARLRAVHGAERPAQRWPWRRLRGLAERRAGSLEIELALEPVNAS
jgi:hypothetical protein